MSALATTLLIAAVVCSGLMAGLFAAFSYAVIPGLARAEPRSLVDGMQGINVAILNGWFGVPFAGTAVLAAAATVAGIADGAGGALVLVVAGLVLHLVTVGVTFAVNIPLNDALAAEGPAEGLADPAAARARFLGPWARANAVRAVSSTASLACLAAALSGGS